MNWKIALKVLLAITFPVWVVPAAAVLLLFFVLETAYAVSSAIVDGLSRCQPPKEAL